MEKRELSYTIGGNVNNNHDGEEYEDSSKKYIYIKVPYGTAIPFQGMYPEKIII